jgi:hypothetical protein
MTDPADVERPLARRTRHIAGTDGAWCVFEGTRTLAGPFETNAEAWRWFDRHEGEPISCSEAMTEWLFEREVRRGL